MTAHHLVHACRAATRSRASTPKPASIKEYRSSGRARTASRSTRPATSGSAAWATTRWAGSIPKTGQMSEVDTGRGSRPRRVADRARRHAVDHLLRQRQARQARSRGDEGREGIPDAGRRRRALRGHRRWRRPGLGQRDQHRHRGALRSRKPSRCASCSCPRTTSASAR